MTDNRMREIRRKADSFREKCKISRYGLIDLFEDCKRLGYKVIRYPLGETSYLGFVLRKDQDIVIFTSTSSRLSRELFTLAHEIGHAVLHMDEESSFLDNSTTISEKTEGEKESDANYFAACLLMPAEEVDRFLDLELSNVSENGFSALDIARIMSEFHVSFDMVLNRLENLQKINIYERLRLDNEKNEKRVGNLLKSVGGNSCLNDPSEVIDIPYEYLDYVIFNYNHNAIPKETLERALTYYKLCTEDISDKLVEHPDDEDDNDDNIEDLLGELED